TIPPPCRFAPRVGHPTNDTATLSLRAEGGAPGERYHHPVASRRGWGTRRTIPPPCRFAPRVGHPANDTATLSLRAEGGAPGERYHHPVASRRGWGTRGTIPPPCRFAPRVGYPVLDLSRRSRAEGGVPGGVATRGGRSFATVDAREFAMRRVMSAAAGALLAVGMSAVLGAQTAAPAPQTYVRPTPPTRDPHTAGYVEAKELPDGEVPPADKDGNFIIGPTHAAAPEMQGSDPRGELRGRVVEFTMTSAESRFYPGIARDKATFGTPDPKDPAKLMVTTSHAAPWTRKVTVYVPEEYVAGTVAPFIVGADGPDWMLFTAIDGLIAERKVPVMIA